MTRNINIESRHEQSVAQQIVDARPFSDRFSEWLSERGNLLSVAVPIAVLTAAAPLIGLVTLPFLFFVTVAHLGTKSLLPIRYPHDASDDKGKRGTGILYMGEVASGSAFENFKEIWLSDDDLRKHMLIIGSTGSGKSEALKSIFYNALNWSSGFFIADGKADNKLPTDVYTMVRSNGRDADMLVLNFLLAGKTPEQVMRSRTRRTNKLNPFPSADADTIIQMGANLLPKVEGDAKNWQEKGLNLWRSVVAALCYKREKHGLELSVSTFIDYMALNKVEELYMEGYQEALSLGGEWTYGYLGIKSYLESGCPAYQVSKLLRKNGFSDGDPAARAGNAGAPRGGRAAGDEQESMAFEQHSYRTNQILPVLNLLDKTYGFIFRDRYSEIDMTDVTLRNRVLVMLIPSLEKSAAEAENLGKLAIACLRVMMSKNLGAEVEGTHEDLLGAKATNSPYPYIVALDELAYYFSDGIAVMFAQARSLGTCMIASAQDLEKLTEGNKGPEAGAMLANQTTKAFMRIDDTGKTAEMVQKVVGKATVAAKRRFRYGAAGYSRKSDVELIEVDRVPTQTLQKFQAGEGIVNALGRTHFMRWFYMGKDIEQHRVPYYRVNRFLQVATPALEDIIPYSLPINALTDPYRKGQNLVHKLSQQVAYELVVPEDAMIRAVGEAEMGMSAHLPAEEVAIALYVAAKQALEAEDAAATGAGTEQTIDIRQRQVPRPGNEGAFAGASAVAPDAAPHPGEDLDGLQAMDQTDDADDDADLLSFLPATPFQRKPAEAVLGFEAPQFSPTAARELPGEDPFEARIRAPGRTASLGNEVLLRGRILSKLVGAPDARDPLTGDLLVPKDDWIGDAFIMADRVLERPLSSDNTVVGFNGETMDQVEKAEKLMRSPQPRDAARSLERVVAVKVTPQTTPESQSIDPDQIDAVFSTLGEKLR